MTAPRALECRVCGGVFNLGFTRSDECLCRSCRAEFTCAKCGAGPESDLQAIHSGARWCWGCREAEKQRLIDDNNFVRRSAEMHRKAWFPEEGQEP